MIEQEVAASEQACELCGRTHLSLICRPCHLQVHAVLTNQQLAQQYHTIEALRGHPEIARFAVWIANKPAGFKVTVRSHKNK
ncbi:hypothetical protein ACF3NA_09295 [Alkanindiges sp. WGS2144]|uniref:hypothetical protein n=1 Tax=Alkanindiges sp. WGS2144 TaxID=3366808 RepID=UPI003752BEEC